MQRQEPVRAPFVLAVGRQPAVSISIRRRAAELGSPSRADVARDGVEERRHRLSAEDVVAFVFHARLVEQRQIFVIEGAPTVVFLLMCNICSYRLDS